MSNKCIECKFHKLVNDPDPNDWFNDDDKAILCIKCNNDDEQVYYMSKEPFEFKAIGISLRPTEIKNLKAPKWCPLNNQ